jgi:transposase
VARVDDRRVISGIVHVLRACRLKDFRRVATRYDKLAVTYAAAVSLAAIIAWWL